MPPSRRSWMVSGHCRCPTTVCPGSLALREVLRCLSNPLPPPQYAHITLQSLLASNSTNTTPCSSQSPESLRGSKSLAGLPEDLLLFSQSFPFTPLGPAAAVQEVIEGHLPLWEHAVHLVDSFLDRAGWLFRTVSPEQIHGEMLPSFYERPALSSSPAPQNDHTGPHDLSLLYMVFAVGALVDLRQEPSNAEAEHYHQIARAAVCLQPVLEKPSLVTVQVLHLLSCYNAMSSNELGSQETSMETTWSLQTLAAHLSQTVSPASQRENSDAKPSTADWFAS